MPKKEQEASRLGSFTFALFLLTLTFLLVLHKPLPPGFCEKSTTDRVILHLFEPFIRAVYYYPSRAFSNLSHKIYWTRHSLEFLAKLLGPVTIFDKSISVKDATWHGVTVRTYRPINRNSTHGAVVFIHGGGFAFGSVEMYTGLTWRMAKQMNTLVVSIDYRRTPEAVFPENLMDCEKVIDYLMENGKQEFGIDTRKVIVIGDSAGGNLATTVAQRRVISGEKPALAGQVLLYPLLQLADLQTISYRYFHKRLNGFAFVDPESVAFYSMLYAGITPENASRYLPAVLSNGHISVDQKVKIDQFLNYRNHLETYLTYNRSKIPERWAVREDQDAQRALKEVLFNPDIFPLFREDLRRLPRSLIVTCDYDTLRDEGIIYAQRLMAAGVPTKHVNYENGFHAMLNMHNEVSEASKCLEDVMEWMLDTFRASK